MRRDKICLGLIRKPNRIQIGFLRTDITYLFVIVFKTALLMAAHRITIEEPCTKEQIDKMKALGVNMGAVKQRFKKDKLEDLTFIEASFVISAKENSKAE